MERQMQKCGLEDQVYPRYFYVNLMHRKMYSVMHYVREIDNKKTELCLVEST